MASRSALKSAIDIDLLIDPADLTRVAPLLREEGYRVVLIALREDRAAIVDPLEATGELRTESREVVGAHLVHGDEHEEPRMVRRGLCFRFATARAERDGKQ